MVTPLNERLASAWSALQHFSLETVKHVPRGWRQDDWLRALSTEVDARLDEMKRERKQGIGGRITWGEATYSTYTICGTAWYLGDPIFSWRSPELQVSL
jgi:hypothetical protein